METVIMIFVLTGAGRHYEIPAKEYSDSPPHYLAEGLGLPPAANMGRCEAERVGFEAELRYNFEHFLAQFGLVASLTCVSEKEPPGKKAVQQ